MMLEGLKEIAAELEREWGYTVSIQRVWRYADAVDDPLPCARAHHVVTASAEAVKAWARRQPRFRSMAGSPIT
jgi:hypothetical protein